MKTLEESVTGSMDGSDIRIREFIPYLLQDIWEIGADPQTMVSLIKAYVKKKNPRILDLGCGKGAVSIQISREIDCSVRGIDAVPEFIKEAEDYAVRFNVHGKCTFEVGDIRVRIKELIGFNIVILGAIGPVFGDMETTLKTIINALITPGYVLLDDGYIEDNLKTGYSRCLRKSEFFRQIRTAGFSIIHEEIFKRDGIAESDEVIFSSIKKRAEELIRKHPAKRDILLKYVEDQVFENKMLETIIITGTWLLENKDPQQ